MLTVLLIIVGLCLCLSMNVIAAPIPNRVQPVTGHKSHGGTLKSALLGPLPIRVAATGTNGPGIAVCERSDGANKNRGYVGYFVTPGQDLASISDEEAVAGLSDCVIDGFTGVVPQSYVWVDGGSMPNPLAGWSGLTHTDPADGTPPIGLGWTSTKIFFYPLRGGVDFHA